MVLVSTDPLFEDITSAIICNPTQHSTTWELNKAVIARIPVHVLMHMLEMISEVLGPSLLSQVRRTEKEFVGVRKDFTTPEQTPTISLVSHPPKTEAAKTPLIRDESEQDRQLQDGERASGG